jgi:hypothetical protein
MARRRRPPRPGALAELPPLKIISQIAALQGLYYGAALILMLFTVLVAGQKFTMNLVFGWDAVRGDTTQGWLIGFIWVLNGGLMMCVPYPNPFCASRCWEGCGSVLTPLPQQGCRNSSPHRPLQTRTRLCAIATRNPLGRRDSVFRAVAATHGVVAFHGRGLRSVGFAGDVGMPLSPTTADIVWGGWCCIGGRGERGGEPRRRWGERCGWRRGARVSAWQRPRERQGWGWRV